MAIHSSRLKLSPLQSGYLMGLPVRLRELRVSVTDSSALMAALGTRAST